MEEASKGKEILAKNEVLDMGPRLKPVHGMRHRTYWDETYGDNGDQRGEIDPDSEQGLFAEDTRFVSFYQIYLNRAPWQLLSSSRQKGA